MHRSRTSASSIGTTGDSSRLSRRAASGGRLRERRSTGPRILPTIAVVPFSVLAGENEQSIIGQLLAHEIIARLLHAKEFVVISRMSTRAFCGSARLADIGAWLSRLSPGTAKSEATACRYSLSLQTPPRKVIGPTVRMCRSAPCRKATPISSATSWQRRALRCSCMSLGGCHNRSRRSKTIRSLWQQSTSCTALHRAALPCRRLLELLVNGCRIMRCLKLGWLDGMS